MTGSIPRTATALALLLLAACGSGTPGTNGDTMDAEISMASAAQEALEAEWRERRREALLAEDGWTSLVGLHWLELPAHYVGSSAVSGIRLALGPERLGLVQQERAGVWFTPEPGVVLSLDEDPVTARIELRDGAEGDATELLFDEGRGRLSLVTRGGRRALQVKHADAPARTAFAGIEHWPVDADWILEGRFVAHPPGQTIEIGNIVGGSERLPNPGLVEFSRDGADYRLEALEGAGGGLFLVLADRTNGHGSYGSGRYLDAPAPDPQGRVVLNFNRAYSPPCAFSDFAPCLLPPAGNRLDLAVEAGEKAYARPASAVAGR